MSMGLANSSHRVVSNAPSAAPRMRPMNVDRASFLAIAGALAASGCDVILGRAPAPSPAPVAATPSATQPSAPITVDILQPLTLTGAAVCDDSQGTAEECPSVGPADEGICPNVLMKRCSDFKAAMKPRVAAQAVACLRALKGNERCDVGRINQCGHAALMSACQEPPRAQKGQYQGASGAQPASVTIMPDATPDASPVATACSAILRSCGEKSGNPTLADCRMTLAGLNDTGRANIVDCVSAHCSDRGLYACEALPKAASAAAN
jgi:hypothetical protein